METKMSWGSGELQITEQREPPTDKLEVFKVENCLKWKTACNETAKKKQTAQIHVSIHNKSDCMIR